MNYKEINDKWKVFLAENTFKEDAIVKPEKKKKRKDKKEIIVSEDDEVNEFEELEEMSSMSGGAVEMGTTRVDDEE